MAGRRLSRLRVLPGEYSLDPAISLELSGLLLFPVSTNPGAIQTGAEKSSFATADVHQKIVDERLRKGD